jgi:CRP-like cAMP-binding protein
MKEKMDIIACCLETKLFRGFSADELRELLPAIHAGIRKYRKGETFVRAGAPVTSMGLLVFGGMTTLKKDSSGNFNLLKYSCPGDLFFAYFSFQASPVTVVSALESVVLSFPVGRMMSEDRLTDNQSVRLLRNILQLTSDESMLYLEKVETLSYRSVRNRICNYLYQMSLKNSSQSFSVPFNREQMAQYLCVERSALSKELGRMRKEGLILFERSHFEIIGDLFRNSSFPMREA